MGEKRALALLIAALTTAQVGIAVARADSEPALPSTSAPATSAVASASTSFKPAASSSSTSLPPSRSNGSAVAVSGEITLTPTSADLDVQVPTGASPALCGPEDMPETGIQGDVPLLDQLSGRARQGYNCGLAVVAHEALGGRGSNANMAWAGHCAYIAGDGIAVVDVSDPVAPRWVTTLQTPGAVDAFETLHAVDGPDRSLLVAGRYGLFFDLQFESTAPVDVYDVSDCANPRLLSTVRFPQSVHNLTLTPDARTVWSTLPLQAYDLTDPTQPRFLGNLENDLKALGVNELEYAHEAWPSADGTRLTIGGQMPTDERSLIVDIEGWPARSPRVVASMRGPGHSIRDATIDGHAYLLRSDESVVSPTALGCLPSILTPVGGAAQAFLTDIGDETQPRQAGILGLDINDPVNCVAQLASGVNASSHYHDVDDPDDTTFAMVSMWNAGLRVFDVRDPAAPREVAYFNPGQYESPLFESGTSPLDGGLNMMGGRGLDQAWAHVRYVPETGHIWLTTRLGGFWVLELEPQLRDALDLPPLPARSPLGAAPRSAAGPTVAVPLLDLRSPALYCTLGRF